MDLKQRAKQLKRDIPALFLAMKDPRTPISAQFLAGFIVFYALSPLDLIPDFIPFLGLIDDIILLPLLIIWAVKKIPTAVMTEAREKSDKIWEEGKTKRWYYGIPVVLIWIFAIYLAVRLIWR